MEVAELVSLSFFSLLSVEVDWGKLRKKIAP